MALPNDDCNIDLDSYTFDLPVDVPYVPDGVTVEDYTKTPIAIEEFKSTEFEDKNFESVLEDVTMDIEEVEISDEYNPNFTPYNIFNDKEIVTLKDEVMGGITDELAKKVNDNFIEIFDTMSDKLFERVTKLFQDSNITGEDAAEIIGRGMPSIIGGVNALIDSMYLRETPADKIVKAVQANNTYKEGKILDANTKIAELESSDKVLLAKLQIIESQAIEAISKAKLAVFESSDEILLLRYKTLYAEYMIKVAQAILAEYESSDVLLNIKLDREHYVTKQEEYKAYIEQFKGDEETLDTEAKKQQYDMAASKANAENIKFSVSDKMLDERYNEQRFTTALKRNEVGASAFEVDPDYLGAKLNSALADAQVKKFEGSEEVIKLKKLILESTSQESHEKVNQVKAQMHLVLRQSDGFNLDAKVKLLGILFDGWSKGFMSGFEGVPAVISNDVMSSLFNNTGDVSNGFNGGDFARHVYLVSGALTGTSLNISIGWDSGVTTGTSTLHVTPSWTELVGYPVVVANAGTSAFTLVAPADGQSHSVMCKVVTNYFDNPLSVLGTTDDCCESGCDAPFVKSSTFIYSIRQGQTCPAGTVWDSETGQCVTGAV